MISSPVRSLPLCLSPIPSDSDMCRPLIQNQSQYGNWGTEGSPLRRDTKGLTVAPTGVSSCTIITVAGRRCNNRLAEEGLCERDTPAALLIYIASRGGGVGMNHPRDTENTAEDVSLNLNAAVYQTLLIPSQVMAHPAVQQFITGDMSMSKWNRWVRFTRAEQNTWIQMQTSDLFTDTGTKWKFMQTYYIDTILQESIATCMLVICNQLANILQIHFLNISQCPIF